MKCGWMCSSCLVGWQLPVCMRVFFLLLMEIYFLLFDVPDDVETSYLSYFCFCC